MLSPESSDELLTPAGVAALLYVDPRTVTRWSAAGRLVAVRTPGGHRRYLRSEVLAIVSGLHPEHQDHDPGGDTIQDSVEVPLLPMGGPTCSPNFGVPVEVDSERQAAAAAVVAEAVALALEAAAAEAAEAVLLTAAAVAEAAGRAAAAAECARQARALAAEAAAQSVAHEAQRTAERVQKHAALAAARVQAAASLAADELARSVEGGTALDAERLAELLAATVRAAADATDEDTSRAADAVKEADSAAAVQVAQSLASAEEFVQREVTATADVQRKLATATAAAVAVGTDARAADVALTARQAAAALVTDEKWVRSHATAGSWDSGNARMSEVAAELSHDLRVPLSSIIASVEMLEDELRGHADGTVTELLGRATRASDRMVRMLEQSMTPRVFGTSLARPEIDLAEVVREFLLDSADLLEPTGAVVATGKLPVVRADRDAMYSVLQNLLTNSVKFARPGVPVRVRISARRSVDGWRISVRDNGVGLPSKSGIDVFSLYSRGPGAVPGHGIGLATVARIVAEHGGRVGATPVKTGAEIWFELPA